MKYPYLSNINQQKSTTTYFLGLNDNLSCQEGEFRKVRNITTQYYPAMSPRLKRTEVKQFVSLQGIMDKESLVYIDNGTLYIDGEAKDLGEVTLTDGLKEMYKLGAFIVIMPDKVWYNAEKGESGYIEAEKNIASGTSISFSLVNGDGKDVTWHDEDYYKSNPPSNGDYMMTTTDSKTSLKVYSSATNMWASLATTYIKIASTGIGKNFKKGDGIKITIDNSEASWDYAEKIFVNKEDDGRLSINTVIRELSDDYISIPAILKENKTFTNMPVEVKRAMPNISYMTECQNRLWACSADGHEIYCSKLGDVTNWNCFEGISTDSYAATVGSDGLFTGCVTYNLNPIFFKENSFIKVSVSATGAHSYREMPERGVQLGSSKSITIIEGLLYYKGVSGVYVFDGANPLLISDKLGEHRFRDAIASNINGRYYISMLGDEGRLLYVYDTKHNLWSCEDNLEVTYFVKNKADLYAVVNGALMCLSNDENGTQEKEVDWMCESGDIGFYSPNNKYVSRLNVFIKLATLSYADFYIKYDDDSFWEHLFDMQGTGAKPFLIPIIPRRCNHFRYMIKGKGDAKVLSVTKELEEGSDI